MALPYIRSCPSLVPLLDPDWIIGITQIEFGIDISPLQEVEAILYGDLVQASIINAWLYRLVFFSHEEESSLSGGQVETDDSSSQGIRNIFVHGLPLT